MTDLSPRRVFRMHDLPSEERPRERLLRLGAGGLTNEELLALLLRTGVPRERALARARSPPAGARGARTEGARPRARRGPDPGVHDRRGRRDRSPPAVRDALRARPLQRAAP